MAVELGVGYITLIPSAKGITQTIEAQLGGPLVAAGRRSGDATSAAFAGTFKKGLGGIQKSLLGTIGVAGIGVGLVKVGQSFENAFNTIARGTGASGKELEGLDKSFKTVLKNGAGSFEQVSTAITKLNQRTGLTGKALEDFAAKEVTLARITKTDVAANLESTTGLFNLYGIAAASQSDALDLLFKASQVAGVSVTQLADEMKQAAPTAKILGFSIDKTASFIAQLDRAGLPAGKVMQGLAGAFSKAAKEGKAPLDVIHDLVEEVKRAPSPTAAATIAIQKYGIGARQAATLVAGLRSGAIDLDKSLSGGKGILATAAATATLSGKLGRLRNEALVGLEPLATAALGAVTRGLEDILPAVTLLTDHMNVLGPAILVAAGAFAAFKVAAGVRSLISGTVDAFKSLRAAVFESTAATAESVAASSASAAAKVADAAAASAQAVELRQLAQATLGAATADAAASNESVAASAAAAGSATAEAVALRAKANEALKAATAGGVVNKAAMAEAVAFDLEATAAETTAKTLRDKAAAEFENAAATKPGLAGASATALGAEATAAELDAKALRDKATAAAAAAQSAGFVGLSARANVVTLEAEATSAELAAKGLRDKAVAEYASATAAGVVDLSAIGAALSLGEEATAAELNAVAMRAQALAAIEAANANKGLKLSLLGSVSLVAAAAVTVLTVKTLLFKKAQKDAGSETNHLIDSLLDEGKTLKDVAGAVLVKAIRDNKSLAETFKAMHVPISTVNEALLGNKKAVSEVVQAAAEAVRTGKINIDQYQQLTGFIAKNARSLRDQKDAYDASTAAAKELASTEASGATSAKQAAAAQDQLRIAATNLTTSIINNVDRLRGLQEGLVGVLQSAINLRQGLVDLREKQAAYNKALKDGDPRATAAALRDLEAAQLGQIGNTKAAVDQAEKQADAQSHLTDHLKTQADAQAALQKIQADSKSTPEQIAKAERDLDRATKSVANSQKIQIDVLTALADRVKGPLHVALLQYLHDINVIPNLKATKVETPGLDAAFVRTHNYRGEMDHLPALKATRITLDAGQAFTTLAEFRRQVNLIPNNVSFKQAIAFEGGRLAKGGRAQPGRDYLVGERGAELLRMYATGGAYVFSNPELKRKGIPELAEGGVFKQATLAIVGENARKTPEIVSPVKLMAETFKTVLDQTISKTVVQSDAAKTSISVDAVQAVKTVKGYLIELGKTPEKVTTQVDADTRKAVSGFAAFTGAVSVSEQPFQRASTRIHAIATETRTVENRLKESTRTIREVAHTSEAFKQSAPVDKPAAETSQTSAAPNVARASSEIVQATRSARGFVRQVAKVPPTVVKPKTSQPVVSGEQVDRTVAAGIDKFAPLVAAATARLGQTIVSNLNTSGGATSSGATATTPLATAGSTSLASAGRAAGGGSFGEFIERVKQVVPQRSGESINEWKARLRQFLAQRSGESINEWQARIRQELGVAAVTKTAGGTGGGDSGGFGEFIKRVVDVIPQRSGESINEWKRRIGQGIAQRPGESINEWKARIRQLLTDAGGSTALKTAAAPSAVAQSGKFAPHLTLAPAAPVVAPAAQLSPTFKTDLQRSEARSFVGVQHQEIHVDRQSFVEEINVANRKLGMRVAVAGRR